ncbi:hypothetical protein [Pseudonocardia sp. NPDC046786]|uniref:hypothetical protein n=1 Tax=Pseudonocardia sp. NPDC046786 TaxID=3155471 RepID=UPI0033C47E9A
MPTTTARPILQSSCARATSKEESAYRIDAHFAGRRGGRVVALDDGAATMVRSLSRDGWNAARFFTLREERGRGNAGDSADEALALQRTTGVATDLATELADADVAVMVATARATGDAAAAAARVGRACARRGVMTAGIVVGATGSSQRIVHSLRPHARVLLVGADPLDVADLLTAIRM